MSMDIKSDVERMLLASLLIEKQKKLIKQQSNEIALLKATLAHANARVARYRGQEQHA
jgi:hypothetical protein